MSDSSIRRYQYIDALRGYAILGVIAIHSAHSFGSFDYFFQRGFRDAGYGVHLFFVASALTLFLSLSKRSSDEQRPYANFFIRRFFRIAPLFWFAILAYYLLGLIPWEQKMMSMRPELQSWNYWLTFSFLHGWSPATINKVVPGDWSIAAEMTFYLFLPWLFLGIKNLRTALWLTIAAIAVAIIFDQLVRKSFPLIFPLFEISSNLHLFLEFNFVRQVPTFLMGIVLYFIVVKHEFGQWLARNNYSHMMLVMVFILCIFLPYNENNYVPESILYSIVFVMFAAVLSGLNSKIYINQFICGLGKISFSGYITHFFVVDVVRFSFPMEALNGRDKFIVTLALLVFIFFVVLITALCSTITYKFIEKPGIRAGNKIITAWEQRALIKGSLKRVV